MQVEGFERGVMLDERFRQREVRRAQRTRRVDDGQQLRLDDIAADRRG
jgi:hypothetical protein